MENKIKFGTDGWRAIIAKDYTVNNVCRVSQAVSKWLLKNNYAHLLALIHGVEGKTDAWYWLKKNEFTTLFHMARGGDSWKESLDWLKERDKILYGITLQMEKIKDEIDEKNNDPHKINP